MAEKVACQYCGKEIAKPGLKNHEKSCAENPDNKKEKIVDVSPLNVLTLDLDFDKEPEEDVEKETKEPETVEEEATTPVKVAPKKVLVPIKLKMDLNTYIGNQWYRCKAGKEELVPTSVKEILMKAGLLAPL